MQKEKGTLKKQEFGFSTNGFPYPPIPMLCKLTFLSPPLKKAMLPFQLRLRERKCYLHSLLCVWDLEP